MNGTLALETPQTRSAGRLVVAPVLAAVALLLLVAALALGFGIRTWTEPAPAHAAAAVPATPPSPSAVAGTNSGHESGSVRRISGAS